MSFIDTQLPADISYRAQGGPEYNTSVAVTAAGYEQRNAYWTNARRHYDIGYVRTQTQLDTLMAFFHAMKGRLHSFRVKDHSDYATTTTDGYLGTGVGTGLPTYQAGKVYTSGATTTTRDLTLLASGSYTVYRNGSPVTAGSGAGQVSIGATTGVVSFVADANSAASAITVGATTTVVLAANPGTLIAGELLYLAGFTGADAALVNGIAHTISSVSGAGPYTFVLATVTTGKTITLGSGTGYAYPQANDTLRIVTEFDVPCRFDTDKFTYTMLESGPGHRVYQLDGVSLIEVRV